MIYYTIDVVINAIKNWWHSSLMNLSSQQRLSRCESPRKC